MPIVSVMVDGGKATASAPLGPALGPLGINIGEVVTQINEKTKEFAGMKVPVKVTVDSATKEFEIEIGSPPISALIKKEAGVEKAAKDPKREFVADLSLEQVAGIAKKKAASFSSYEHKSMVKEVLGTCNSMGITVNKKRANLVIKEIDAGKHGSALAGGTPAAPAAAPKEEAEAKPPEPAAEPAAEEAPAAEAAPAPEAAREKGAPAVPEPEAPAEGPKKEPPAKELQKEAGAKEKDI